MASRTSDGTRGCRRPPSFPDRLRREIGREYGGSTAPESISSALRATSVSSGPGGGSGSESRRRLTKPAYPPERACQLAFGFQKVWPSKGLSPIPDLFQFSQRQSTATGWMEARSGFRFEFEFPSRLRLRAGSLLVGTSCLLTSSKFVSLCWSRSGDLPTRQIT